jgi:hypothetical protein
MKRFRFAAVVVMLATGCAVLAEERKPSDDGFVALFNGKDLGGWVNMGKEEGWSVRDGVIHSDGAMGGNWLRSEKEYDNFVFKVDWKVSKGGNSGVFIRAAEKGAPWVTGYEVQISNAPRDDAHCTGSLYGYVAVKPRPDESPDKWHTFEIHCKDSRITVLSDGVKCVDFDQAKLEKTKDKPLKGFIGLQDAHASKGNYIEYRNVKLKVLD